MPISASTLTAGLLTGLALLAAAPAARADSAPDAGIAFEPEPVTRALYGVKPPEADPQRQRHVVAGHDGTELYVETYLPAPKDGFVPPKRVPTILMYTPYEDTVSKSGAHGADKALFTNYFASHGYAVAIGHVRGTGRSGGCFEFHGPNERADIARVIEYLGRDAPWSNRNVGMFGLSYEGGTQWAAATSADRKRTKYLKAIVPMAGTVSFWEVWARDGVPFAQQGAPVIHSYGLPRGVPGPATDQHRRAECLADVSLGYASDGDFNQFWQDRETRRGAHRVQAAVLFSRGLYDIDAPTTSDVGLLDRIPATTPLAGIVGQFEHFFPDRTTLNPDWRRADWMAMVRAWYDRWLLDLPTGAEEWPRTQVQDMSGQWRTEPAWPTTGGPVGQLALGAAGTLGSHSPSGETPYQDVPFQEIAGRNGAIFETAPVKAPLHLTGQPSLDLWVVLQRPEAHITARLEVLDAAGNPMLAEPVFGMRSARHLDPLVDGRFEQDADKPAPVGEPLRVPIRIMPLDVTVPVGGRLRLTISGSVGYSTPNRVPVVREFYTQPSGEVQTIRILHDCVRTSVLRFLMPREDSQLLNVREPDEGEPADTPLASNPSHALEVDGGGIATRPVCGQAPQRDEVVGPARPATTRSAASQPRLRAGVRPRRVRTGRRTAFVVTVWRAAQGRRTPVPGAMVTLGDRWAITGADGRARLVTRLPRGLHRVRVHEPRQGAVHTYVRVRR